MASHPSIVQGGMGVGVSGWRLARAVAQAGGLGVVSGTAVAVMLARQLWRGDASGDLRRALAQFPDPAVAARVLDRWYRPAGTTTTGPFPSVPQFTLRPPRALIELTVAASFVEVFLAKQDHDGRVGINLLEKIQLPTLPTLYGAMLAGVDDVFMGAGIPARIPAVLDQLTDRQPVTLPIAVTGAAADDHHVATFDPTRFAAPAAPLRRPLFAAIVSSATLARYLAGSSSGAPDGFVVELPVAGGHNAPPRGRLQLSAAGEPVYGTRDEIELADIAALGLPFWIAGGQAHPAALTAALAQGAAGIQVGTAFAFCSESGIDPDLRRSVLAAVAAGKAHVFTDPVASPTGYPFKTVSHPGTVTDPEAYRARERRCDLGYLRELYVRPDGNIGYRCPAEPVADYLAKGGDLADTSGRQCLCNGLVATIGLGQTRPDGYHEPPLVTAGDDLIELGRFLPPDSVDYSARDVIDHLTPSR